MLTNLSAQTTLIETGFISRLNALLDRIGLKEFGRVKYVADASGLSWSGAKALFSTDRPPKQNQSRKSLFNKLAEDSRATFNPDITNEQIESYLLNGIDILHPRSEVIESSVKDELSAQYNTIEPTFQAQCMSTLLDVAEAMEINLFEDIPNAQSDKLFMKFTVQCYKDATVYDMYEPAGLKDLARSLIHVAKSDLL